MDCLNKRITISVLQDVSELLPFSGGGIHIEQSLLVLNVQLIKGSGLMEILNLQKLSTIGLSAVVNINSKKRATYCIQVTLSTLKYTFSQIINRTGKIH